MAENELGRWPITIEIPVAWGDMDALGHVNNTVYIRWFESARITYFERLGALGGGMGAVVDPVVDPNNGVGSRTESSESGTAGPILARQSIDYRLPLTYPDTVRVAISITRLGTTSFNMAFKITSRKAAGALAAQGEGVIVMVDYAKGTKIPLSESLRAAISTLEAAKAAEGGEAGKAP